MRILWLLFGVVLIGGSSFGHAAIFKKRMSDKVYQQYAAELVQDAKSKISQLRKSGPPFGVIVIGKESGYQADSADIELNDVIVGVDKTKIYNSYSDWNRKNSTQVLHYYRGNRKKALKIEPGIVGVRTITYSRPDVWYANSKYRNPKWDRDVLVALSQIHENLDLAETAWMHALKKGLRSKSFLYFQAALLNYYRGKAETAMKLYTKSQAGRISWEEFFPKEVINIFIANGEMVKLKKLLQRFPKGMSKLNGLFVDGPLKEAFSANVDLQDLTPHYESESILDQFRFTYVGGHNITRVFNPQNFEPFTIQQSSGYYRNTLITTPKPLSDVDVTVVFKAKPDQTETYWARAFEVALVKKSVLLKRTKTDFFRDVIIRSGVEYKQNNEDTFVYRLQKGTAFYTKPPGLKLDGHTLHTLRIVKVSDTVAVYLNNKIVTKVPVKAYNEDLGLYFFASGMRADVVSLSVKKLTEKFKPEN